MQFLEFKNKLNSFIPFSLSDIQLLEPNFNLVQLSQWQKKGYIKKIIKGKYVFADISINEEILYLIANSLLSPSYISLETALQWYKLIPEGVYTITSISTVKAADYQTDLANFSYQKIKLTGFFGDQLNTIPNINKKYRIACPEKALVDYFYFHNELDSIEAIKSLRLNLEVMKKIDWVKLKKYTELMGSQALISRVNLLTESLF